MVAARKVTIIQKMIIIARDDDHAAKVMGNREGTRLSRPSVSVESSTSVDVSTAAAFRPMVDCRFPEAVINGSERFARLLVLPWFDVCLHKPHDSAPLGSNLWVIRRVAFYCPTSDERLTCCVGVGSNRVRAKQK